MTMNVLVLHSSDEAYGSDRMCVEFVRNLVDRGCHVTVGLPDDSEPGWLSAQLARTNPSIRILRLPLAVARRKSLSPWGLLRWGADAFRAERALRQVVRAHQIDVLYLNSLALIAQVLDVRLVPLRILHCHEIATITPLRLVQRMCVHLVDHVICVSQAVADVIPSGDVHVCRNGVADLAEAPKRAPNGPLRVGFVGRLSHFKGIERFLEVSSFVERDDVEFDVTGGPIPGEQHYLKLVEAAADANLVYRGEIEDTSAVFLGLDVLVVPSATPDPYPTVVLEALRAGCIVITTALGGAKEAFDADAGFVVDATDAKEIARTIDDLATDRDRVDRMQLAARETYESRHRLDAFDKRFQSTLDNCGLPSKEEERRNPGEQEQCST